ncbi:hypothetical protein GUITHDRAFT_103637 [Guillardia theta CCMP2712]|uniref:Sm domain-containing protein n=1 Tax=Guillardia theta (strain CCMP2712) TaxID=905079 RepID=L1JQ55_GUITC|nr:hypothetical protein GUITHDRAFT_103637 [Guillardia theta CCMP2712]EKX50404.1 hypothetical protein GUITHDRAFT_103637 [Guillardia theta CCMP2712]|eukprot:XP_005837384.1 hypothetical protein GUITHDRAFT_103637 [Guillardia theta CCMP2712]
MNADKKQAVLDLSRHVDQKVRVKFSGGREVEGRLKGFDTLVNLVLDECIEYIRDPDDPYKLTNETRQLGLIVCRGTAVTLVCPCDGMMEIANPFISAE